MPINGINSKTDICNLALSKLGHPAINNVESPESKVEKICALWIEPSRRTLLKLQDFNFAVKRVVLPKLSESLAFGEWSLYLLPDDFIKFLSIDENETREHSIEGNNLLVKCGEDSLNLRYVYDYQITTQMDPIFIQSFACILASNVAYPITNSNSAVERLKQELVGYIRLAAIHDAKDSPIKIVNNFRPYIRGV